MNPKRKIMMMLIHSKTRCKFKDSENKRGNYILVKKNIFVRSRCGLEKYDDGTQEGTWVR